MNKVSVFESEEGLVLCHHLVRLPIGALNLRQCIIHSQFICEQNLEESSKTIQRVTLKAAATAGADDGIRGALAASAQARTLRAHARWSPAQ